MSSFRIIFRNFMRSFLCTMLSVALSALLAAIVTFFMRIGGAKSLAGNPYWVFIGLIPSAVVLFFFYVLWSNVGYRDSALFLRRKKHIYKLSGACLLLLLHILIALTAIVLYALVVIKAGDSSITAEYKALTEQQGYVSAVLGAVASCQLGYFIVINLRYKEVVCPRCKHVFCVERKLKSSTDLGETTQYKTTNERENIGSVEYGESKAEVYANVRKGYSRTVHKSRSNFVCCCKACGQSWRNHEVNVKYGEWK